MERKTTYLIGAGFSKAFGGFLASEFAELLLCQPAFREQPFLRQELVRTGDFEVVLHMVRGGMPNLYAQVLRDLDQVFRKHEQSLGGDNVSKRLSAIDGIESFLYHTLIMALLRDPLSRAFTLNQDALLERSSGFESPHGPLYFCIPHGMHDGVEWPRETLEPDQFWRADYANAGTGWHPDGEFRPGRARVAKEAGHFHVVKLHGSWTWRRANSGLPVLVVGQDKRIDLEEQFFSRMMSMFRGRVREPGNRLIVVGYSFRDEHINEAICGLLDSSGGELEVFDVLPIDRWYQAVRDAKGVDPRLITRLSNYSSRGVEEFLLNRVPSIIAETPVTD